MYSPKIDSELIPELYQIRVAERIPMTRLVNQVLTEFISRYKHGRRLQNGRSNQSPNHTQQPTTIS